MLGLAVASRLLTCQGTDYARLTMAADHLKHLN